MSNWIAHAVGDSKRSYQVRSPNEFKDDELNRKRWKLVIEVRLIQTKLDVWNLDYGNIKWKTERHCTAKEKDDQLVWRPKSRLNKRSLKGLYSRFVSMAKCVKVLTPQLSLHGGSNMPWDRLKIVFNVWIFSNISSNVFLQITRKSAHARALR